ncbi:hypothetical protein [Pseudobdellovibrio sp. HCB154]|uniref:hypothetical protein n=1 Tax=Pseudobdellovibrio sp. HCB154 TaxID=3386277 RepID=UPI003916EEB7
MNPVSKMKFKALVLILAAAILSGCGAAETVQLGEADLPTELGNQLGDVMASIDDAGGGNTTIAQYAPTFDRYNMSSPKQVAYENIFKILLPEAQAATCGATFSACSSNTKTRTFGGCSIGNFVLNGSVTMTWSGGANCTLSGTSQSIRIAPNYSVAGNNMTLTATKTGTNGASLTWISGAGDTRVMNYTNDGINRTLSYNGTALLSITTRTNSPITVTNVNRGSRSLSSAAGALEIVNNTSGESCTFMASGITYGATNCNCATSGSWVGSCSSLGNISMSISSCGLATLNYTEDGSPKSKAIALDRCVQN